MITVQLGSNWRAWSRRTTCKTHSLLIYTFLIIYTQGPPGVDVSYSLVEMDELLNVVIMKG